MSSLFLTDFSDRLSPMLVKELRQGLRAKTFVAVFLTLQIFLALMMFSATASSDNVGSVVSGIIFGFFAFIVIVIQPLRGVSALSSEVKSNTLDMMALTRLTSSKIVLGKWVAIASQSALLLCTIFPYLILRYFLGGMNFVGEIVLLALLFLTSLGLTAVTVGLSGCSSVIIRALVPIFSLPFILWIMLFASFGGGMGGSLLEFCTLTDPVSRYSVLAYVIGVIYLTYSFLSLGASLIASAAENHCILRRLFSLVALLLALILNQFNVVDHDVMVFVTGVIVAPAVIIALTESAPFVGAGGNLFNKLGAPGKIIALFFQPVWSSGVIFSVLIGVLAGVMILNDPTPPATGMIIFSSTSEKIIFLSLLGSLYFPGAWQALFYRGASQRIGNYLTVLIGSFIMLGLLLMIGGTMRSTGNTDILWFFTWTPLTFIAMEAGPGGSTPSHLHGIIILNLLMVLIILGKAFMEILKFKTTSESPEPVLPAE